MQLMFLKKEKKPTTKLFDDDEWIQSLTKAETITADIREGQETHADPNGTARDQGMDPKKVRPTLQIGECRTKLSVKTAPSPQ